VCVCDRLTVNEEITQAAVENPNNMKWEKMAKWRNVGIFKGKSNIVLIRFLPSG